MKNVSILIWGLGGGGAERVASLISIKLIQRYNIFFFVLDAKSAEYEYAGVVFDIKNLARKHQTTIEETISDLKEKLKIDVSISFLSELNAINVMTRRNEKVILTEHIAQAACVPQDPIKDYLIKRYYNNADHIITVSEGVKIGLTQSYGVEKSLITTVYNYIDKRGITVKSEELIELEITDFLSGSEYFINVGRLSDQKNQLLLVDQFNEFHKNDDKNYKLLIVGTGLLKTKIHNRIEEYNLEQHVKVFPFTQNPFPYIRRAKALILCSKYEGLSNVILEALALGCPVIASDCIAGPREILMDRYDYETPLPMHVIGKRGVLLGGDRKRVDPDICWGMQWVINNVNEVKQLVNSGVEYITELEDTVVDKWQRIIEKTVVRNANELDLFALDEQTAIKNARVVYIFGAGKLAKKKYEKISGMREINAFIVSSKDNNPSCLMGIPVKDVDEVDDISDPYTVVKIGVNEKYVSEIVKLLESKGVTNMIL